MTTEEGGACRVILAGIGVFIGMLGTFGSMLLHDSTGQQTIWPFGVVVSFVAIIACFYIIFHEAKDEAKVVELEKENARLGKLLTEDRYNEIMGLRAKIAELEKNRNE